MSHARQKGTAAETSVAKYMQISGFPLAERRALGGVHDKGDLVNIPGVIEVKNQARWRTAEWLKEAQIEAKNAGEDVYCVWAKRPGKTDPADWYWLTDGRTGAFLLRCLQLARENNLI